jgi:hypothetical protein
MKQLLLFIVIFILSVSLSYAAIITVDNTTPSVGNYKTLLIWPMMFAGKILRMTVFCQIL